MSDRSIEPIYREPEPVGFIVKGVRARGTTNHEPPVNTVPLGPYDCCPNIALSADFLMPASPELRKWLSAAVCSGYRLKLTIELDRD